MNVKEVYFELDLTDEEMSYLSVIDEELADKLIINTQQVPFDLVLQLKQAVQNPYSEFYYNLSEDMFNSLPAFETLFALSTGMDK